MFTLSISCLNVSNTSLLFTNASLHLLINHVSFITNLVKAKTMNIACKLIILNCFRGREQTWNCWNFSPSDVSCTRKFFSVVKSWETRSAYTFIWDCSWITFSSCCLIFNSDICSSSVFCFICSFRDEILVLKPIMLANIKVEERIYILFAHVVVLKAYIDQPGASTSSSTWRLRNKATEIENGL